MADVDVRTVTQDEEGRYVMTHVVVWDPTRQPPSSPDDQLRAEHCDLNARWNADGIYLDTDGDTWLRGYDVLYGSKKVAKWNPSTWRWERQ